MSSTILFEAGSWTPATKAKSDFNTDPKAFSRRIVAETLESLQPQILALKVKFSERDAITIKKYADLTLQQK